MIGRVRDIRTNEELDVIAREPSDCGELGFRVTDPDGNRDEVIPVVEMNPALEENTQERYVWIAGSPMGGDDGGPEYPV